MRVGDQVTVLRVEPFLYAVPITSDDELASAIKKLPEGTAVSFKGKLTMDVSEKMLGCSDHELFPREKLFWVEDSSPNSDYSWAARESKALFEVLGCAG